MNNFYITQSINHKTLGLTLGVVDVGRIMLLFHNNDIGCKVYKFQMRVVQHKNVVVFSLKPKWCSNSKENELSSSIINSEQR